MQLIETQSIAVPAASNLHARPTFNGEPSLPPVDAVSADEARAELDRVLQSADFPATPRNRRFLSFIAERALDGPANGHGRSSAYDVATRVFGRSEQFDTILDPIVRIEAGKLRRDLETYYLKSGKHDPIRIFLPKGSYRAAFQRNEAHLAGTTPSRSSQLVLRAALLGLGGGHEEASAAWCAVEREYPDFALNPHAHKALEVIHAQDDRIRELLLEGLHRAARPAAPAMSNRPMAVGQLV